MPIEIDGQTYFRTAEVCDNVGISRSTLYRWLKGGILEMSYRDRRGWRMLTEDDLNRIQVEVKKIEVEYTALGGRNGRC